MKTYKITIKTGSKLDNLRQETVKSGKSWTLDSVKPYLNAENIDGWDKISQSVGSNGSTDNIPEQIDLDELLKSGTASVTSTDATAMHSSPSGEKADSEAKTDQPTETASPLQNTGTDRGDTPTAPAETMNAKDVPSNTDEATLAPVSEMPEPTNNMEGVRNANAMHAAAIQPEVNNPKNNQVLAQSQYFETFYSEIKQQLVKGDMLTAQSLIGFLKKAAVTLNTDLSFDLAIVEDRLQQMANEFGFFDKILIQQKQLFANESPFKLTSDQELVLPTILQQFDDIQPIMRDVAQELYQKVMDNLTKARVQTVNNEYDIEGLKAKQIAWEFSSTKETRSFKTALGVKNKDIEGYATESVVPLMFSPSPRDYMQNIAVAGNGNIPGFTTTGSPLMDEMVKNGKMGLANPMRNAIQSTMLNPAQGNKPLFLLNVDTKTEAHDLTLYDTSGLAITPQWITNIVFQNAQQNRDYVVALDRLLSGNLVDIAAGALSPELQGEYLLTKGGKTTFLPHASVKYPGKTGIAGFGSVASPKPKDEQVQTPYNPIAMKKRKVELPSTDTITVTSALRRAAHLASAAQMNASVSQKDGFDKFGQETIEALINNAQVTVNEATMLLFLGSIALVNGVATIKFRNEGYAVSTSHEFAVMQQKNFLDKVQRALSYLKYKGYQIPTHVAKAYQIYLDRARLIPNKSLLVQGNALVDFLVQIAMNYDIAENSHYIHKGEKLANGTTNADQVAGGLQQVAVSVRYTRSIGYTKTTTVSVGSILRTHLNAGSVYFIAPDHEVSTEVTVGQNKLMLPVPEVKEMNLNQLPEGLPQSIKTTGLTEGSKFNDWEVNKTDWTFQDSKSYTPAINNPNIFSINNVTTMNIFAEPVTFAHNSGIDTDADSDWLVSAGDSSHMSNLFMTGLYGPLAFNMLRLGVHFVNEVWPVMKGEMVQWDAQASPEGDVITWNIRSISNYNNVTDYTDALLNKFYMELAAADNSIYTSIAPLCDSLIARLQVVRSLNNVNKQAATAVADPYGNTTRMLIDTTSLSTNPQFFDVDRYAGFAKPREEEVASRTYPIEEANLAHAAFALTHPEVFTFGLGLATDRSIIRNTNYSVSALNQRIQTEQDDGTDATLKSTRIAINNSLPVTGKRDMYVTSMQSNVLLSKFSDWSVRMNSDLGAQVLIYFRPDDNNSGTSEDKIPHSWLTFDGAIEGEDFYARSVFKNSPLRMAIWSDDLISDFADGIDANPGPINGDKSLRYAHILPSLAKNRGDSFRIALNQLYTRDTEVDENGESGLTVSAHPVWNLFLFLAFGQTPGMVDYLHPSSGALQPNMGASWAKNRLVPTNDGDYFLNADTATTARSNKYEKDSIYYDKGYLDGMRMCMRSLTVTQVAQLVYGITLGTDDPRFNVTDSTAEYVGRLYQVFDKIQTYITPGFYPPYMIQDPMKSIRDQELYERNFTLSSTIVPTEDRSAYWRALDAYWGKLVSPMGAKLLARVNS
jgi:hypothetical protein